MRSSHLVFAGIVLLLGAHTSAYTVQTTSSGQPLAWVDFPVGYAISEDVVSDWVPIIQDSFQVWEEAVGFDLVEYEGRSSATYDEATGDLDGENTVIWVETGWDEGTAVIGLTYDRYEEETGEILEGDLTFNAVDYCWATDGDSSCMDVADIATHEAGHFFGLDHSTVEEATMYADAVEGELEKADLHSDDVEGIQSIYAEDEEEGGGGGGVGCSLITADRSQAVPLLLVVYLIVLILQRRRTPCVGTRIAP